MHSSPDVFAANSSEANSGGDDVVALHQSRRAGLIDSIADGSRPVGDPDSQWI
jgi:hypothetical protein